MYDYSKLWMITSLVLLMVAKMVMLGSDQARDHIPTTLEGPFKPATRRFDPSLRRGSDDLPMDHPRLKKNVTLNFPEQISLAISSPTAMWVSWVTGTCLPSFFLFFFQCFFFLCWLLFVSKGIAELGLCNCVCCFRGCPDWEECDTT